MVRACSLVATETPLMVLHQFAGRLKLELTFHESNGGCESPFAARVRLRSTTGSSTQPLQQQAQQQPQQQQHHHSHNHHPVLAEATGVVSLLCLSSQHLLLQPWWLQLP